MENNNTIVMLANILIFIFINASLLAIFFTNPVETLFAILKIYH